MASTTKSTRRRPTTRKRRERGSISADEIVRGAFEVAEKISIEDMSMPILARHLDVGATSIYWYFHKKDDLLNAMADRAMRRYERETPFISQGDWDESLRTHLRTMRDTFRKNPVLCDLIILRTMPYAEHAAHVAFQKIETIITALVGAGFTPTDARDTYAALILHLRGTVLLERLQDASEPPGADPDVKIVNPNTMPYVADLIANGHMVGIADDWMFEYGIDCILNNAWRLLDAKKNPAAKKATTARAPAKAAKAAKSVRAGSTKAAKSASTTRASAKAAVTSSASKLPRSRAPRAAAQRNTA